MPPLKKNCLFGSKHDECNFLSYLFGSSVILHKIRGKHIVYYECNGCVFDLLALTCHPRWR